MYLFISTKPCAAAGGFVSAANHRGRTFKSAGSTPTEAAQRCALRFFFGNGATADSANKIVLTQNGDHHFMARLKYLRE